MEVDDVAKDQMYEQDRVHESIFDLIYILDLIFNRFNVKGLRQPSAFLWVAFEDHTEFFHREQVFRQKD